MTADLRELHSFTGKTNYCDLWSAQIEISDIPHIHKLLSLSQFSVPLELQVSRLFQTLLVGVSVADSKLSSWSALTSIDKSRTVRTFFSTIQLSAPCFQPASLHIFAYLIMKYTDQTMPKLKLDPIGPSLQGLATLTQYPPATNAAEVTFRRAFGVHGNDNAHDLSCYNGCTWQLMKLSSSC